MPPLISEKNSDLCGSIIYSILARFASQVFMSKYEAKNLPLCSLLLLPVRSLQELPSGPSETLVPLVSSFSTNYQLCRLVGWIIVLLNEHMPSLLYPLSAKDSDSPVSGTLTNSLIQRTVTGRSPQDCVERGAVPSSHVSWLTLEEKGQNISLSFFVLASNP